MERSACGAPPAGEPRWRSISPGSRGRRSRLSSDPSGLEVEQRGFETILVVEDEEPVRRMIRKALERSGYRILEAGEGAEALAIARSNKGTSIWS